MLHINSKDFELAAYGGLDSRVVSSPTCTVDFDSVLDDGLRVVATTNSWSFSKGQDGCVVLEFEYLNTLPTCSEDDPLYGVEVRHKKRVIVALSDFRKFADAISHTCAEAELLQKYYKDASDKKSK